MTFSRSSALFGAVLRGERRQARRAKAQRNHIGLSLRTFVRLECHCFTLGLNWMQAKLDIIRDAVRTYLDKTEYPTFYVCATPRSN